MEELKKDLKAVLSKHGAYVHLEEDEGFLYLRLVKTSEDMDFEDDVELIDSDYRDLSITEDDL